MSQQRSVFRATIWCAFASRAQFRVTVGWSISALRIRVLPVGVRAVDDMGRNMVVDEGRNDANDDNAGEKEADEAEARHARRQSGLCEVLFGGGEHAIERGENLDESDASLGR